MLFAFPNQLYWLIAFVIILFLLLRRWSFNRSELLRLIENNVIEKIFPYQLWSKLSFRKLSLQLLGLFFLILALTGPQIGKKLQEIKVKGSNVFILFDTSSSMLVEDFKPTRLEKSKILLSGLLEKMAGNRVGIIAFAGESYVFCPLTFDFTTVKQFLRTITPGMIPQPGTRIGNAIRLALSKMTDDKNTGVIVLLTDGEDHKSDPIAAAEEAKEMGVTIFSIGIGSPEGQPIPEKDPQGNVTGYKKDKEGKIILSKLDENTLAQISGMTGGVYFRASSSEREIDILVEKIKELEKNPITKKRDQYENRYQWFLLIAFILLLGAEILETFSYKKFKFTVFFFIITFFLRADFVGAESFNGKLREGNDQYEKENYEEALKKYNEALGLNPQDLRGKFNKGAAHYKLEEWEKAQEEFQKGSLSEDPKTRARALYNLGNSQFKKGDYKDAVLSYQQSLKLDPSDEDTKHNLKLALQFKKNPPPKQKQSQSKKDKQKKGQKSKEQQKQDEEKKNNAKRILKGASEDDKNRPQFKPKDDGKNKKKSLEDW